MEYSGSLIDSCVWLFLNVCLCWIHQSQGRACPSWKVWTVTCGCGWWGSTPTTNPTTRSVMKSWQSGPLSRLKERQRSSGKGRATLVCVLMTSWWHHHHVCVWIVPVLIRSRLSARIDLGLWTFESSIKVISSFFPAQTHSRKFLPKWIGDTSAVRLFLLFWELYSATYETNTTHQPGPTRELKITSPLHVDRMPRSLSDLIMAHLSRQLASHKITCKVGPTSLYDWCQSVCLSYPEAVVKSDLYIALAVWKHS